MNLSVLKKACFLMMSVAWAAGAAPVEPQTIRSRSGQFIVHGLPLAAAPVSALGTTSSVSYVRLDPSVLAVSCEQVKEALLAELALEDRWRSVIHIRLHPMRMKEEPIRVVAIHYTDGWVYRVEVPEQVDRERLFRALVEVLLQELASRRAGARQPEVPLWLVAGLRSHLDKTVPDGLGLEPQTRIVRRQRHADPLEGVRECLRTNQLLTLGELSWPRRVELERGYAHYEACAQLLVNELLRLRDGRRRMALFLQLLPRYLNWQNAFLEAFRKDFATLTAADKWWTLTAVSFSGREQMFQWFRDEALAQLEALLRVPVQVRTHSDELPMFTQVPLQTIMGEWSFAEQGPLLQLKLNHLQALRLRVPPEHVFLVDRYLEAIALYLEERARIPEPPGRKPPGRLRELVRETIDRLEQLDQQRRASAEEKGQGKTAGLHPLPMALQGH